MHREFLERYLPLTEWSSLAFLHHAIGFTPCPSYTFLVINIHSYADFLFFCPAADCFDVKD